jgi:aminomethyltransferase
MALYGHELDDTTNPVEAGLIAGKLAHEKDFSGRAAIEAMLAKGPPRRLVGFRTDSPRVPRQGYALHLSGGGAQVGVVCSGSPSPTLGTHIGTAYVQSAHAGATTLDMDIRGQRHAVKLQPLPFYQRAR